MSAVDSFVEKLVEVILYDGRVIVGRLKGCDLRTNLILADCFEREYSAEGVEIVPLGLYMIKGDNVALVGEIDEEQDASIEYAEIRAEPLAEIRI